MPTNGPPSATPTRSRPSGGATRIPASAVKSVLAAIVLVFAVALAGSAAPARAAGIPCWKARGDILRAQLDAIREHKQPTYDEANGAGGTAGPTGDDDDRGDGGGSSGLITRAIEWLGPSNADAIPLPLLILAGVAF